MKKKVVIPSRIKKAPPKTNPAGLDRFYRLQRRVERVWGPQSVRATTDMKRRINADSYKKFHSYTDKFFAAYFSAKNARCF